MGFEINNFDEVRPILYRNILLMMSRGLIIYDGDESKFKVLGKTANVNLYRGDDVISNSDIYFSDKFNNTVLVSNTKPQLTFDSVTLVNADPQSEKSFNFTFWISEYITDDLTTEFIPKIIATLNYKSGGKITLYQYKQNYGIQLCSSDTVERIINPTTLLCPEYEMETPTNNREPIIENFVNSLSEINSVGNSFSRFNSIGNKISEMNSLEFSPEKGGIIPHKIGGFFDREQQIILGKQTLEKMAEKYRDPEPKNIPEEKDIDAPVCEPESLGSESGVSEVKIYNTHGDTYTFVSSGDDRVVEYLVYVGLINQVIIHNSPEKVYATLKSNVMIGLDVLKEAGVSEINFTKRKITFTYDNSEGADLYSQAEYGFDELLDKVLCGDIYVRNYGMDEGRKLYIVKIG